MSAIWDGDSFESVNCLKQNIYLAEKTAGDDLRANCIREKHLFGKAKA